MSMLFKLALLLMCVGSVPMSAQNIWYNWVFGNNAGVTFRSTSGNVASRGKFVDSMSIHSFPEGSASFSDPCSGELFAYASAHNVYDSQGNVMPNGAGIAGGVTGVESRASQGALFVPVQTNKKRVLLFTAPSRLDAAANRLNMVHIIDMNLRGGLGDVTNKNIALERPFNDMTCLELQSATHHAKGNGYWLVTSMRRGQSIGFVVYHIDSNANITVNHTLTWSGEHSTDWLPDERLGSMAFSPNGKWLAVVGLPQAQHNIMLIPFDNLTGRFIANPQHLQISENAWSGVFSYGGKFLYIGCKGRNVYRFDIDQIGSGLTLSPEKIYGGVCNGSLQLAPNGKIYVTGDCTNEGCYLDEITTPEYVVPEYTVNAVFLPDATFGNAMNTVITSSYIRPAPGKCIPPRAHFTPPADICVASCVSLTDESSSDARSWNWTFEGGTPSASSERNPTNICYAQPGTYKITLTVANDANSAMYVDSIIVRAQPNVDAGPDMHICSTTVLRASGASTYVWTPSTGLSDPTSPNPTVAFPAQSMTYIVRGTNEYECIGHDTVIVYPHHVELIVPNDTIVCPGENLRLSFTGADTYNVSSTGDVVCDTCSILSFSPSLSQTIKVIGYAGSCSDTATLSITVKQTPNILISGPTSICIGNDVQLIASGATTYSWSTERGVFLGDSVLDTPTRTTAYKVIGIDDEGCSDTTEHIVIVHDSARVVASAQSTTMMAGQHYEVSIRIESNVALGNRRLQLDYDTTVFHINNGEDTSFFIDIVTGTSELNISGLALLSRNTVSNITPFVILDSADKCTALLSVQGTITLEGCGIYMRPVGIVQSSTLSVASLEDRLMVSSTEGSEIQHISWYDPVGICMYSREGTYTNQQDIPSAYIGRVGYVIATVDGVRITQAICR